MIDQHILEDAQKSVSLTDDQKRKLVADACKEWRHFSDMTGQYREDAMEARQLYLENKPLYQSFESADAALESSSRLRRPVLAEALDSVHAQQHLSSFPSDESFFSSNAGNEVAKEMQNLYEGFVQQRFEHDGFMMNTFSDRKNLLTDGISIAACPFVRKTREKAVYKFPKFLGLIPIPGRKPTKEYVEVVEYEGTPLIPLSLEDWQIDPTVDDFELTPILWRRWESVHTLTNNEKFENTDDLKSYYETMDLESSHKRITYEYKGITYHTSVGREEDNMGELMALVMERWGDFVIEDKLYQNHVLIFSNDCNFHYFGPNPYDHGKKPFVVAPYNPVSGTLFGKSLAKDIIPLAHALDTLLNQAIDIISRYGNPAYTYLVSDTALAEFFSEGAVPLIPGMGIPVQTHDSLRPLVTDIGNLAFINALMQALKEEIREATGGVPYTTGGISTADTERTATETNALVSGTSSRFQNLVQFYEKSKLEPYLHMTFENDRQFMSEPVFVKDQVLTPNTVKMMDLTFKVTGSKSIMNRSKQINDLKGVLMDIVPPLIQGGMAVPKKEIMEIDIPSMVKELVTLVGTKDVEERFKTVASPEQQTEETTNPEALNNAIAQGGPSGFPALPLQGVNQGPAPIDMAAA